MRTNTIRSLRLGAIRTDRTVEIGGSSHTVFTLGDSGASLIIEDHINVVS